MPAHPSLRSWSNRLLAVFGVVTALAVLVGPPPASADDPDPVGVWPLQPTPEVLAGFDPPDAPWGSGHRGVDLLGVPGQSVHTALAGRVSFAGLLAGRGVVVVDHGETRTTYEPVTAGVAVGDVVPIGAVIGELQPGGSHCPPQACLHWGWLRGEVYLDPLGLVGGGPVRLLPLWRNAPVPLGVASPAGLSVWGQGRAPPAGPYATVLERLDLLVRPVRAGRLERSPPYARGCACW
jgi:murein DD-endopeptidase MepM/ murein hydrolase activator NlpD